MSNQVFTLFKSNVAEQISVIVPPDFARSLNVVYFPQLGRASDPVLAIAIFYIIIGYLICVPMLEEWKNDIGIEGLDGWTFQVSTDHAIYLFFLHWYLVFIRVSFFLHY